MKGLEDIERAKEIENIKRDIKDLKTGINIGFILIGISILILTFIVVGILIKL